MDRILIEHWADLSMRVIEETAAIKAVGREALFEYDNSYVNQLQNELAVMELSMTEEEVQAGRELMRKWSKEDEEERYL
jgi:hypothetical protein